MHSRQRIVICCRAMESAGGPLPLDALARLVGCAPRQIQRDFQTIGTSPAAYGRVLRSEVARRHLQGSANVSRALYEAGYGSVRAFYEQAGRQLGMAPATYAAGALGVPLLWAITPSAVGLIIAVASPDGLCAARIGSDREALVAEIAGEFRRASLREDEAAMRDVLSALRALALGGVAPDLPIDVRGTAFQARVWQALRRIPQGETRTYGEVAATVGSARAVRAVASACANNPVALAVPCHRVIRSDGSLAGYAWGLEVKEQLLAVERAQAGSPA